MLNVSFDDVDLESYDVYDVLVVFGGCVLEYICLNEKVLDIVCYFDLKKKFIVVFCYGLQVLVVVNVFKGKCCIVYFVCVFEVIFVGGEYVEVLVDEAIVDGFFVIGFVWFVIFRWLVEFLKVL